MPVPQMLRRWSGRTGFRRGLNRLVGVPGAINRLRDELVEELRREHELRVREEESQRVRDRSEWLAQARHERDRDRTFAARFFPHEPERPEWVVPATPGPVAIDPEDGFAIPPPELWSGYGNSPETYLECGRLQSRAMLALLRRHGFRLAPGHRVLDFGCGAGRLIRFLEPYAADCEIWGVDIHAGHIHWCQQHLSPPFRFVTTTTLPHLPFEDHSFDLIYAGSFFTQIADLTDFWLMELRRVLRPGGVLHASVHDTHAIEVIRSSPEGHWLHDSWIRRQLDGLDERHSLRDNDFAMFAIDHSTGSAQVFHDTEYLRTLWGRYFEILEVTPGLYAYQTGVTMAKPRAENTGASAVPARWSTSMPLDEFVDAARPYAKCPPETRKQLQDAGINVEVSHFYSCIPTDDEVRASFEYQGDGFAFLDETIFPPGRLRDVLAELDPYADEFAPGRDGDRNAADRFFWDNGMFSCSDAVAYYAMIRLLRPRRIIEIGCGFSTLVALEALERNGCGAITCVEPYPMRFFENIAPRIERHVARPVQELAPEFFNEELTDGDILFIDTTHTVKAGSDCVWLYLKVLPYLQRRLMIHAHDIFLPRGYPQQWLLDLRYFWTEQYLLHALLLGNPGFEVCYGSAYHLDFEREALTQFMRGRAEPGGSSLWFRSLR